MRNKMGVEMEVKMEVKVDKCYVDHKCIVHFNSLFNSFLLLPV